MYRVLDLFCGAGGLSLGFQNAGFKIVGGVDFDEAAMATHSANFNGSFEFCGDIAKLEKGIDVIVGGPPCQGFSSANRYLREEEDARNKLFFEFIRFIRIIQPKLFLIENVPGILSRDDGYAKRKIIEITEALGYHLSVDVLSSDLFGVPQKRKRAFFVGVRQDINQQFCFSNLKHTRLKATVKDAISDLEMIENGVNFNTLSNINRTRLQKYYYNRNSKKIYNHEVTEHSFIVVERIKFVPQGGNWKDIPSDMWKNNRNNRHSSAYRRLSYESQSITIDTGHMNYFHPKFNRVPTVRESARIQTFKDSFVFHGTKTQQYRQVGNAVPPLLAQAIAMELLRILKGSVTNENS